MPIVRKEEVLDDWSVLIEQGQGLAEQLLNDTQGFIGHSQAPAIRLEVKQMAPSFVRGLLGGRRPFLVVTNTANSNLRPYRMYINARDYGNNLDVAWYLVFQVGFWRRLLGYLALIPLFGLFLLPFLLLGRAARARREGMLDLDLFDQQDLRAYVTNAHHCLLKAVEKAMIGLNQDPAKIERKSRGFLGIS